MSASPEFCEVVLDNWCTAAPGVDYDAYDAESAKTRALCFACGLPVCLSCSTVRLYCGARHRVCANCEKDRFEDGEARVLLRMYHRAGYPGVRLADCRAELAGRENPAYAGADAAAVELREELAR